MIAFAISGPIWLYMSDELKISLVMKKAVKKDYQMIVLS